MTICKIYLRKRARGWVRDWNNSNKKENNLLIWLKSPGTEVTFTAKAPCANKPLKDGFGDYNDCQTLQPKSCMLSDLAYSSLAAC